MPRRSHYTAAGSRLAQLTEPRRADLHVHTTQSDGEFTTSQVVAFARQANLAALAITDHDTLAAVELARTAAGDHLELVPGVEITAGFGGREVHLLGYFIRTDHAELNAALARLCDRRRERFRSYAEQLAGAGFTLPEDRVRHLEETTPSLGRRHVAGLLVAAGFVQHRTEAFHRVLKLVGPQVLPKLLLPVEEAIRLVRDAGGASSLAHPPTDLTDEDFGTLAGFGLNALEAEYPWGRKSLTARLRLAAGRFGFAVTGGSDCHGPVPAHRCVGSHGITSDELELLRGKCAPRGSGGCQG